MYHKNQLANQKESKRNNKAVEQENQEFEKDVEKTEQLLETDETAEAVSFIDLSNVESAATMPSVRSSSSGDMRIINTTKNGKRIIFNDSIINYLSTSEVEIGFLNKELVIAPKGSGINKEAFKLRVYGKHYVLYRAQLVEEITEFFELDYSDRTTHSLEIKKSKAADGTKVILASK